MKTITMIIAPGTTGWWIGIGKETHYRTTHGEITERIGKAIYALKKGEQVKLTLEPIKKKPGG